MTNCIYELLLNVCRKPQSVQLRVNSSLKWAFGLFPAQGNAVSLQDLVKTRWKLKFMSGAREAPCQSSAW